MSVNNFVEPVKQHKDNKHSIRNGSQEVICTLESSPATNHDLFDSSPSTISISRSELMSTSSEFQGDSWEIINGSIYKSCHDLNDMSRKLKELENAMLGATSDDMPSNDENWTQLVQMISGGNLKDMLIASAKAIANNDMLTAEWLMSELRHMVSVSGEPIERLGAYMLEGLVAHLASSGDYIYKTLKCSEPTSAELLPLIHSLFEICPFFKFGCMSANGAIAEVMKNESRIHIIDFQISHGSQWVSLIQALAARPGGPPHVRITGLFIDDTVSEYARGEALHLVGQTLSRLAGGCNLPFEFNAAELICDYEVKLNNLTLHPGEALAVNFAYALHHVPDESVTPENHRDSLLRLIKSFSPKVVTLTELESNTNTAPFFSRFLETLDYFSAVFESIDAIIPRDHKMRINIEQHCLAKTIVNIIACEGTERVERLEEFGKWRSRFSMAGFKQCALSSHVNSTVKALLKKYSTGYRVEEQDGVLYLGWRNRNLIVSCAWQ